MNKTKIVIKEAKNKEKFLVVKGGNGETIVTSETYKTNAGVNKAVDRIKGIVKDAVVVDKTKKVAIPKKKGK